MLTFTESCTESNCYILEEDGHSLIIDPNEANGFKLWLQNQTGTIDYVLLTHEHCDHVGGLGLIRELYETTVICSNLCNEGIQNPRRNMSSILEVYLHFRGIDNVKYDDLICEPADITFDDDYVLTWRDYKISMHRIPGHTVGSTIIYVKKDDMEEIAFTGDYLIKDEHVITRMQSGDTEEYYRYTKEYLENLPNGLHVYPGHGVDYKLDEKGKWKDGLSEAD